MDVSSQLKIWIFPEKRTPLISMYCKFLEILYLNDDCMSILKRKFVFKEIAEETGRKVAL